MSQLYDFISIIALSTDKPLSSILIYRHLCFFAYKGHNLKQHNTICQE